MVMNKEGMPPVPEEKSETEKLLDCLEAVEHRHSHPNGGAGDHRHYHSPYEQGENHHGNGGKHHGYTPNKNSVFQHNEHSHSHTHEGEGDPLAVFDVGGNEIVIAEHEFSHVNGIDWIQA